AGRIGRPELRRGSTGEYRASPRFGRRLCLATRNDRPIDLHVHTTASDGDLSPGACVERAAALGLAAIGIADHDTTAGNAEALAAGRGAGIEVVPGVEVAARHEHRSLHLLGYYPEAEAPELEAVLATSRARRDERNPQILERLAALGCPVSLEEVAGEAGYGIVGRAHIAAVMVRRGYVANAQEAFDRYLAKGAAAYVERRKPGAAEVLTALLDARAVPVLAHPGTLDVRSADAMDALLAPLVDLGLRGLEVYYHAHNRRRTAVYLRAAQEWGLVATGGSDFHGRVKPDIELGRGLGNLHVPYALLGPLKAERSRL
ncbi:MAG: PHP domain-containing protein, partial [Planctomycetota bacterium]